MEKFELQNTVNDLKERLATIGRSLWHWRKK